MNKRVLIFGLGIVVLLAVVLAYSNHFYNEFHFDDSHTIQDNAYIRDLKNIPLYFKSVQTSSSMPSHQGYRPMVTTTLAIDYALSMWKTKGENGYDLFFYHLSNFTWFLIIIVLLYFLQKDLYQRAQPNTEIVPFMALVGCLWYGLLTPNAETVNYIISRSDILSTLAIVASFAIYIQFKDLRKYYLYVIPSVVGMFAKETTIMFAPLLVAYDFMVEKQMSLSQIFSANGIRSFLGSILTGLPALVIGAALAILGIKMTQVFEMSGATSGLYYRITQPYIVLHYVVQFFFPFGLTADTDIPGIVSISDDRLVIGFAFLAGLIWLAFKASEKTEWRPAAYGIVWFLVTLLPTALVPLAEVTNDHRVFLPYIGLVIAVVNLIGNLYLRLSHNKAVQTAMVVILLLVVSGYGYGVHERNQVWKTDESLWRDVTEKSPNNGRGWMNYGLTLMGKGDYTNADYCYQQALAKTPRYYILHINIGILKEATGNSAEAEQYFKNALTYGDGKYVEPFYYYSRHLLHAKRIDESVIYCEKGLQIFGGHVYSLYLLMDIYNYAQNWPKLKEAAQRTLAIYPNDAKAQSMLALAMNPASGVAPVPAKATAVDFLNQSLAYYQAGRYRECIDACNKALELQPNYAEAYNNMCSAYNQLGKFDSAVIAGTKAVELKPDFQLAKNNLNWAKSQLKK